MKVTLFLYTFWLLFIAFSASAVNGVIVGILIDGLHQKNGNGDYDKIVEGTAAKIRVLTPTAAEKLFMKGDADCLSPANNNANFYQYEFPVITSKSMFQAKIYAYTAMGEPAINKLSELTNLRVGSRSGMPYGKEISEARLNLVKARDIETNVKRLKQGKIDVFIAYWPDSDTAFSNLGISPLTHDQDTPLAVHDDQIVCRDTEVGRAIIEAVNSKL